jgi:hypothetical protein
MISHFDKKIAATIHDQIVRAIASIAAEYGATATKAGGTVDSSEITFKVKFTLSSVDGKSKAQADWDKYAPGFGFKPEHFGATFATPEGEGRIVGINPSARKRPVIYELSRQPGNRYVVTDSFVRKALGCEYAWEKKP